ncbi:hypothetical protein CLOM_g24666 [Closterium sp. NIES-68]|nr:hypothetical protein CLOM_g24666 [Closterium sp. NIES-68]
MFKAFGSKKEKFEFRFRFHATRVPATGFERLVVSLIPVDTGKLEGQTPKGVVRNGTCTWTDTVTEVARLARNPKGKGFEQKVYRLIVSTGSTRGGILGEATLNLADFAGFNQLDQRALPLKYCPAGTVLHVTIQCTSRDPREGEESDTGQSENEEDLTPKKPGAGVAATKGAGAAAAGGAGGGVHGAAAAGGPKRMSKSKSDASEQVLSSIDLPNTATPTKGQKHYHPNEPTNNHHHQQQQQQQQKGPQVSATPSIGRSSSLPSNQDDNDSADALYERNRGRGGGAHAGEAHGRAGAKEQPDASPRHASPLRGRFGRDPSPARVHAQGAEQKDAGKEKQHGGVRARSQSRERGRERDKEKEREREKEKEREREKVRERERERDRYRDRDDDRHREKERERERGGDRYRERERERDRSRGKEREKEKEKEREREERERLREKEKEQRERLREKEREKERERREREREMEKEREREREKEREKEKEREREREREKERERERELEKEREKQREMELAAKEREWQRQEREREKEKERERERQRQEQERQRKLLEEQEREEMRQAEEELEEEARRVRMEREWQRQQREEVRRRQYAMDSASDGTSQGGMPDAMSPGLTPSMGATGTGTGMGYTGCDGSEYGERTPGEMMGENEFTQDLQSPTGMESMGGATPMGATPMTDMLLGRALGSWSKGPGGPGGPAGTPQTPASMVGSTATVPGTGTDPRYKPAWAESGGASAAGGGMAAGGGGGGEGHLVSPPSSMNSSPVATPQHQQQHQHTRLAYPEYYQTSGRAGSGGGGSAASGAAGTAYGNHHGAGARGQGPGGGSGGGGSAGAKGVAGLPSPSAGAMSPVPAGPIPEGFSPLGSVGSSMTNPLGALNGVGNGRGGAGAAAMRDYPGELAAAEAAIEELQRDCVKYQLNARNLTREVESLRSQLAEAITQDQRADIAIGELKGERDQLQEELNQLRMGKGGGAGDVGGSVLGEGSEWSMGGAGGMRGGMEGSRELEVLMEEVEYLKGTVDSLSAQLEVFQRDNVELSKSLEQAEGEAAKYRRDAEESFEDRREAQAVVKRLQKQMEEREAEWSRRLAELAGGNAAPEGHVGVGGSGVSEGVGGVGGSVQSSVKRSLFGGGTDRRAGLVPRNLRDELELATESEGEVRGGYGSKRYAGYDGQESSGTAGMTCDDESMLLELQQKVEDLEREAQELTAESLELATNLNIANKEAEQKDALIERLKQELVAARGGRGLPASIVELLQAKPKPKLYQPVQLRQQRPVPPPPPPAPPAPCLCPKCSEPSSPALCPKCTPLLLPLSRLRRLLPPLLPLLLW